MAMLYDKPVRQLMKEMISALNFPIREKSQNHLQIIEALDHLPQKMHNFAPFIPQQLNSSQIKDASHQID